MKTQYKVFMVDTLCYGNGRVDHNKTYVGSTYAVSPAKACANIAYRNGIKKEDLYCHWSDGGYRQSRLVAEVA